MDTLPLPPRPNLEQYKKRAKDLVAAAESQNANAVREWATDWLRALANALDVAPSPFVQSSMDRAVAHIDQRVRNARETKSGLRAFTLADAQYLIADAHGFASWGAFVQHLGPMSGTHPSGDDFEGAADAIVTGRLEQLESLIRKRPELVRARSSRVHRVTLLHYVAANGVEDFRQKTPSNAVAITKFLLDAGSEVDATAETYGGGPHQTTMNLLVSSAHPAGAGLQTAIAETLLDYGAAINGVADDESPLFTALDFGYGEPAEMLVRRGARVDNVVTAAAVGDLQFIERAVVDKDTLAPGVPLIGSPWWKLAKEPSAHIECALAWACKFARADVALHMLRIGVPVTSADNHEMTALHWAAANGMTEVIEDLLRRHAPLEVENAWQGTVLNSTLHFALYIPVRGVDYVAVVKRLLDAGANARDAEYPTNKPELDALLRQHGAGQ